MNDRWVAAVDKAIGDFPGFIGNFTVAHARFKQAHIVVYLVVRHAIYFALIGRRFAWTNVERAREIRVVTVATDGVGIQCDQLARANFAVTGFIKPRVCTRPRREKTGFDKLAPASDHLAVHDRKQLVFSDARFNRGFDFRHGGFTGGHRLSQTSDFFRRFDATTVQRILHAIVDIKPLCF